MKSYIYLPLPSYNLVTTFWILKISLPCYHIILMCLELQIERNHGYRIKILNIIQDGSYRCCVHDSYHAIHSIHSYLNVNDKQEILFLKTWTNGSFFPH
jgi:hypothetical protein